MSTAVAVSVLRRCLGSQVLMGSRLWGLGSDPLVYDLRLVCADRRKNYSHGRRVRTPPVGQAPAARRPPLSANNAETTTTWAGTRSPQSPASNAKRARERSSPTLP